MSKDLTTLRKVSKPVDKFDSRLVTLIDDMVQTMHSADGMGLAAVQVGVLKRVFIVEVDNVVYEIVNPTIVSTQGECVDNEGCLSVEGYRGDVPRPQTVTMNYQDRQGNACEITMQDYSARALLHEYDHLDGILFCDKMIKKYETK